jgi:hypothetical protein
VAARWLSGDPLLFEYYAYVENRPLALIDPRGLLSIRVGSASYFGCGNSGQTVQFILDKKKDDYDSEGGFIIQHVVTWWRMEACPGQEVDPKMVRSAPCGKWNTRDPDDRSREFQEYWEMWDINRAGESIIQGKSFPLTDMAGLDPRVVPTSKTRGHFFWSGFAYFVKAKLPPGGWKSWGHDAASPALSLWFSCNEPVGSPDYSKGQNTAGWTDHFLQLGLLFRYAYRAEM